MKFFLLLDAAFASNRTFAAVLLGLILCLIVLILLALLRKGGKTEAPARGGNGKTSRSAPAGGKAAGGAPLVGALARERAEEPVKTVPAPQPQPVSRVDEKSIDKHYADQSGKWVCRYCETLNHNTLGYCQACGRPRS